VLEDRGSTPTTMLLEYGLVTLVLLVLFAIADRLTQLGLVSIFATYTYTIWAVFPV
jgi:1,4-dihydroxy-2-naphthoate octaprenyltransferase